MNYRIGYWSEQGPREENQDSGLALTGMIEGEEVILLGVCDGVGGDQNGRRAAQECVCILAGFLASAQMHKWAGYSSREAVIRALEDAIIKSYDAILDRLQQVMSNERVSGLTTTLVAAFMWRDILAVWWLGDSGAYQLRQGKLHPLTRDHSRVMELGLTPDKALEHPEKSAITRFIRPGKQWKPEIKFYDWQPGDIVFLASDGLKDACRPWELEAIFNYLTMADISPNELARRVIEHVRDNLDDNATLALAMHGVPKPLGRSPATLDWQTFLQSGVRDEIVNRLQEYPSDYERWRDSVPLAQAGILPVSGYRAEALSCRVRGISQIAASATSVVCLSCGRKLDLNTECPDHGSAHLWEGDYLEIRDDQGRKFFCSIQPGQEIVITKSGFSNKSATQIELQDEFVSPIHLTIKEMKGKYEIRDHESDNGVWVYSRKNLIYNGHYPEGYSILVGKHRITFLSTRSNLTQETASRGPTQTTPKSGRRQKQDKSQQSRKQK